VPATSKQHMDTLALPALSLIDTARCTRHDTVPGRRKSRPLTNVHTYDAEINERQAADSSEGAQLGLQ
jgi:hypothetical protein